jgi:hypothetical protein
MICGLFIRPTAAASLPSLESRNPDAVQSFDGATYRVQDGPEPILPYLISSIGYVSNEISKSYFKHLEWGLLVFWGIVDQTGEQHSNPQERLKVSR